MTTRILVGDVCERLAELPDGSVQCVVTSPPYYGLRDYGVEGQLGLESTLAEHIDTMVAVFREVRRVLRDDGTLWLNIGDSYAGGGNGGGGSFAKDGIRTALLGTDKNDRAWWRTGPKPTAFKPKSLMMVPARLAIALQDDGWYLRSDIVWAKPNPMPESVIDRPTSAHEHIFLLTKNRRYFYDADAIREQMAASSLERLSQDIGNQAGSIRANGGTKSNGAMKAVGSLTGNPRSNPDRRPSRGVEGAKQRGAARPHEGLNAKWDLMTVAEQRAGGANARNVWTIATMPYKEAHFATFPPEIPRRCILAGTSAAGACPACGAPLRRSTDVTYENPGNRTTNGPRSEERKHLPGGTAGYAVRLEKRVATLGWLPSCDCDAGDPVPCVVLDPFLGSGTTLLVADQLGRDGIGIELNPVYAELADKRIREDAPMFADVVVNTQPQTLAMFADVVQ